MSWIQRFFQKHFPDAAKSMEENHANGFCNAHRVAKNNPIGI